ncbi:MAG: Nicotinate-nucleotide--dimethylbenzimidazole phosphoribosyltransferase [Gammaproteobacteria bacterium]|nr:Nicotinate-nucleotide--dimethylbenzimidazole phosphoribosyltransferase [Gammaproteobacteria bacterium]
MSREVPAVDAHAQAAARARQQQLTKPPGSLGRLEDLACWFAARMGEPVPAMPRCEIFVFAADHGVATRGVSAFPQSVTAQMVSNFAHGGAAINVLASLEDCRIEVVDVGVASEEPTPPGVRNERVRAGTRDLAAGPAMTAEELTAALGVGERCAREAVNRGAQLLIAGEMGIANSTAAACLICAFTGATPDTVVGRGTGVDDAGLARKREVVQMALARVGPETSQAARRTLSELGGLEIAAMAGFYIESARSSVPVVLDGYISTAAALAAVAIEPGVLGWMLASHRSAEHGHGIALAKLGLEPLLNLGLRLGEGTGAALALPIVRAALALHRKMATFGEAGVSGALDEAT